MTNPAGTARLRATRITNPTRGQQSCPGMTQPHTQRPSSTNDPDTGMTKEKPNRNRDQTSEEEGQGQTGQKRGRDR